MRPILPGASPPIVYGRNGILQRSPRGKQGERFREAIETTRVLLNSPEAERYTLFEEYWGKLPAWCRDCREERWIGVEDLRAAWRSHARGVLTVSPDGVLSSTNSRKRPGRVAQ